MEVHQCLDAFKLRVISLSAPTVDATNFQATVQRLRVDLDTILEARVPKSEALLMSPLKTQC